MWRCVSSATLLTSSAPWVLLSCFLSWQRVFAARGSRSALGGAASWRLFSSSSTRSILKSGSLLAHPGWVGLGLASLPIRIVSVAAQKMLIHVVGFFFFRSEWASSGETLGAWSCCLCDAGELGLVVSILPSLWGCAVGPSEGRTELNVAYFLIISSIPWGKEECCSPWKDRKACPSRVIYAKPWDCEKEGSRRKNNLIISALGATPFLGDF